MSATLNICETFRARAFATWDLIGRAHAAVSPLGEETLTDLNLLELRLRHPDEVITHSFSKQQEGAEGADWEWWLTGPSGRWLGLRVQAKVIDVGSLAFPHLHYRQRAGRHQSELLIQRALTASPPRIPLYCLYCCWPSGTPRPQWNCGTFGPTEESYGCSLVSAPQILALRQRGARLGKLSDVAPSMWPWHCLICCQGFSSEDLPKRAHAFWQGAILAEDLGEEVEEGGSLEFDMMEQLRSIAAIETPPAYVAAIMEGAVSERPDDNLLRVTILRETA